MSDVRALLKAKRQEARITHPLASYTSAGQLRCIACGTAVKHASAWEGHIGSKAHRTNAARLREERAREEERERESLKRKAMEVDGAVGANGGAKVDANEVTEVEGEEEQEEEAAEVEKEEEEDGDSDEDEAEGEYEVESILDRRMVAVS